MGLKYNSIEQHVTPRPRSKRLREVSGGAVVTGQGTSSVEGGLGDGHTHANLKDLDKISFDDEKYLYVTQRENDVLVKDKAKCGTADNLSAESTDWGKILRKDIDDRTDHSLSIGKDLTVECKATISELMATAMSSATATISDLTATALKATSATILGALTADTVGATTINAKNCIAITDALSIDYSASYVRLQSIAKDISLNPNGYYVGIGTTTPQYKLDINGNARIVANLYADSTVGTSSYVSHTTGWRADNQGNADFRTVYSDELNVLAFTAQVSQALAGSDYLTKSVSKLSVNFTIPNAVGQTARLIVDDLEGFPGIQCFANGDYIRLRPINRNGGLIVGNVYGTVALDTSFGVNGFSNGTQAYTFTVKSITNGAGLIVYKGAEILDYGTSGSGLIRRTTLDAAGSPYMDIDTWANDPSVGSNLTTHVRLGNLSGIASCSGYGIYSDNAFFTKSIVIGDLTKVGNYLSFDTVNGLQIKLGGTSVATTSDVTTAVNNIQVGGTNLILYSEVGNFMSDSCTYDSTNHIWTIDIPVAHSIWGYGFCFCAGSRTAINPGEYLTYSCEIYSDVAFTLNHDVNNSSIDGNNWGGNDNDDRNLETNFGFGSLLSAGAWHKVWFTIKARTDKTVGIQNNNANIGALPQSSAYTIKVRHIKIEKGNKATDWTPAPEDVDASIASAQSSAISTAASNASALYVTQTAYNAEVTILQNSIGSKVSQTDFNALGTRVGSAESTITQHSTDIASKVSQTDFNALGQRVSTAETNITSNANSISAQATNINNLTGRLSTAEAKITSDAINLTVKSQVNTSYNNAVSVAATDATTKANAAYNNAVSYTNSQITATNNSITASVNAIQIGGRNLLSNSKGQFKPVGESVDNYQYYYSSGAWLENGKVYTLSGKTNGSFSPNHANIVSNNCVLWICGNGYYIIVSDLNTGTTGTIFTWNYPTGTYYLRVNVYHPNSVNNIYAYEIKIEEGNKKTTWTPAPEDVDASIASAQSSAISTAASNASALYVTQSAYSAQVSILQNSINAKVSQTDFNSLGTRVSTAESNITQNANNIASKVSAADYTGSTIASLINQSADSVVISANHINIQGAVTFSSFSSDLQSTINGKATTSYVDSNVSTCLNKASTAQSTANTALSNAAAANNTLANALGGKTIIVGGYIDTNLLEANSILTKALTSSTIIANNATIANLNMVNANVSGVINATSGKFGCLITDGTEYGEIYNEGLDSEAMLVFTYKSKNVSTKIGTNIYPAMAGIRGLASFKNSETNYNYGSGYNYGISVTAENADTNVALSIGGGYVQGFALKVGMFYGGTESNPTLISRDVNVALLMTTGWYQFPDMQTCDDGHLLMIKRLAAGSSDHGIRVKTNLGWHVSNKTLTHTQAGLIVDQGWYGTDVTIGSLMDSMTYIYSRDLNMSSYHGMWVEWKNPRDW